MIEPETRMNTPIPIILVAVTLMLALCSYRLYVVLNRRPRLCPESSSPPTRSLAVFLGSGGHTSEALHLLSSLDFTRYTPRRYIVSEGDHLSAQKAIKLEQSKCPSHESPTSGQEYIIITIPRARRVHQSLFSTPPSALWSLLACIYYLTIEPTFSLQTQTKMLTDVLILNGPGTCTSLCIAVIFNRFLGLPSPRVIYVESFARVHSLSASGRLLRPLVDRFIVQWPQLLQHGKRGDYVGWLI